jgi:hypothetical protein
MHPLHEHFVRALGERLQRSHIVVVYDPDGAIEPFIARELPRDTAAASLPGLEAVCIGAVNARLAWFDGSYLGLRAAVEPIAGRDRPDPLLVYLPFGRPDETSYPLLELEQAGASYTVRFKHVARSLLQHTYTDGQIDELLARPGLAYDDVAALLSQPTEGGGPPSVLRTLFGGLASEPLVTRWLADQSLDGAIAEKGALGELALLVERRLGLTLPPDADVAEARAQVSRYLLVAEFRADLSGDPPAEVSRIPSLSTKEQLARAREVLTALRHDHPEAYLVLADRIEGDLRLAGAAIDAGRLGAVDTFRFEEQRLLEHAAQAISAGRHDQALTIITERHRSFWVDRDVDRQARWNACRLMALLGQEVARIAPALGRVGDNPTTWVNAYAAEEDGWHRVDGLQRELESWVAQMDDDLDDVSRQAHAIVRGQHDDLLKRMADGFGAAFRAAGWTVSDVLHQTRVYPDVVKATGGRTAYFFVDALRYEMGVVLTRLLEGSPDLAVRPAVAALPTITPVGMAALLPGAAGSFSVVQQGPRLGARIDSSTLTGLADRQKAFETRVPGLVDLTLYDVIQHRTSWVKDRVEQASLVVVRSQEIDQMGELGNDRLARWVMDAVVADLARAIHKLAAAGVERFVVSADHGHLFARPREDDMKLDSPGGDTVDLHRRCWIGRGGATPNGAVRVSARELGYDSDLDFIFPLGLGVFKAGGGLSYHHGGVSLQELIVPVVTLRAAPAPGASSTEAAGVRVRLDDIPTQITNRAFSIGVLAEAGLFSPEIVAVRVSLVSGPQQVAMAGMAVGADLDTSTGVVRLTPGVPARVGFLLGRDDMPHVQIVLQDPVTDAVIIQSVEIPVSLGI